MKELSNCGEVDSTRKRTGVGWRVAASSSLDDCEAASRRRPEFLYLQKIKFIIEKTSIGF